VVDISHPEFEDQIKVVEKTLADLGCSEKPSMIIFNKVDAYTWVEKDKDDLTQATKENISLDNLIHTWMSRLSGECLFISALEKTGYDTLRQVLYNKVREMHVQKYPYNDFLFEHYEEG
jgi:GTP-binding protein HflX